MIKKLDKVVLVVLPLLFLFVGVFADWTYIPSSNCGTGCYGIMDSPVTGDTYVVGFGGYIRKYNSASGNFPIFLNLPYCYFGRCAYYTLYFFDDNFGYVPEGFMNWGFFKWNGTWTMYDLHGVNVIYEMDCINRNFCIMGGGASARYGSAAGTGWLVWNGTHTKGNGYIYYHPLYRGEIVSVSCTNSMRDFCWFGTRGGNLYYWNWTYDGDGNPLIFPSSVTGYDGGTFISDIFMVSNSSVWHLGSAGERGCPLNHYNGHTWSLVAHLIPSGGGKPVLYMLDDNNGWMTCGASIYEMKNGIIRYNGTVGGAIYSIGVNRPSSKVFVGTIDPDGLWENRYTTTTTTIGLCEGGGGDDFEGSVRSAGCFITYFLGTGLDTMFPSTNARYLMMIIFMVLVGGGVYALTKSVLITVFALELVLFFGVVGKFINPIIGIGMMVLVAFVIANEIRKVFGGLSY